MNVRQLKKELNLLKIPKRMYSVEDDLKGDAYILRKNYYKWECFYFDEKGIEQERREFQNEDEACVFFLDQIKKEFMYYRK